MTKLARRRSKRYVRFRPIHWIGSAEISTVWVDPDFDADERAFYYVRVLEIPTERVIVSAGVLSTRPPAYVANVQQGEAV